MEQSSTLCFTASSSPDIPLHLQSCKLQTTESDMDKKMKAILILLEEDGHNPERRGTNQNREQQIINMLGGYHRSHQSLAEKYEYLRSIFVNILYSGSSSSSNAEKSQSNINNGYKELEGRYSDSKRETSSPHFKAIAVDGSVRCNNDGFDVEFPIKLRDESITTMLWSQNDTMYGRTRGRSDFDKTALKTNEVELCEITEVDNSWNELSSKVTMLVEENLQHQEDLARRNNEKREAIKELHQQVESLKSEIRALQISLRFSKEALTPKRSYMSRLSDMISDKILRRGCS